MVQEMGPELGIRTTCEVLGVPRATYYRHQTKRMKVVDPPEPSAPPSSPRALSPEERAAVLELLCSERYVNASPRTVWATELDEGRYHCSVSSMYRILTEEADVRERRNQLRHPNYVRPELLATAPNQLWSWDITKLKGPGKSVYFCLYVILDVFSRYVVGWMVAGRESQTLAAQLIQESCRKQQILEGELTLHADRGSSMKSKTVAQLLMDLGVAKTHSRPHVSNDNPYSEAAFKTMKYHPEFPGRFGSVEDARAHFGPFFSWYNNEHRHTGLGLMTPAAVHYGEAEEVWQRRQELLEAVYQEHPERFVRGVPKPPALPEEAWINRPEPSSASIETPEPPMN